MISIFSLYFGPTCWYFQTSTGNRGVDQLNAKFFCNCGIAIILFLLIILALFRMTGSLKKASELSQTSSAIPENQQANPCLQMDFDAELKGDLFGVRGNIMFPGNSSLTYLVLNAALRRGRECSLTPNTC